MVTEQSGMLGSVTHRFNRRDILLMYYENDSFDLPQDEAGAP